MTQPRVQQVVSGIAAAAKAAAQVRQAARDAAASVVEARNAEQAATEQSKGGSQHG